MTAIRLHVSRRKKPSLSGSPGSMRLKPDKPFGGLHATIWLHAHPLARRSTATKKTNMGAKFAESVRKRSIDRTPCAVSYFSRCAR